MLRILDEAGATSLARGKTNRMAEAEAIVAPILAAVRERGDAAVREYARALDGFEGTEFLVGEAELAAAEEKLTPEFRAALETASQNIRAYAQMQMPRDAMVDFPDGRRLGQIVRPLESMGAYIPAGRYPLPSTVLMTVIPAQVAGVETICIACPKPSLEILAAAHWLGVRKLFRIGGAQAIAAMAYGTETVPKADRIVGPGNVYVAAAKKLVSGETGIDFVAGPTEIVILSEDGDPRHLAADMLAQAEHDVDASAILVTTSIRLAEEVAREVARRLQDLPTAATARVAIEKNSACIVVGSMEAAAELANGFAPEHLSLHDAKLLPLIRHAGSVFVGPFSPEAAGDYASGPNHVLPTSGVARLRGGLSAADFVKVISVQELTSEGLRKLAPAVTALARAEGLEGHARSVEVRLGN